MTDDRSIEVWGPDGQGFFVYVRFAGLRPPPASLSTQLPQTSAADPGEPEAVALNPELPAPTTPGSIVRPALARLAG